MTTQPIEPGKKAQRRRPQRLRARKPPDHTIAQILAWADAFHARNGRWPRADDGRITGTLTENWRSVDGGLRHGHRGLPSGSSLPQLLAQHRGHRNKKRLRPLTVELILKWADAFYARTKKWPTRHSGGIPEAATETWRRVNDALTKGLRGMPLGWSLAQLLASHRGVRNRKDLPRLRVGAILRWADLHQKRTGAWPREKSGPVLDAKGETWGGINAALREGLRGLPGGSSLYELLVRRGRMRPSKYRPLQTKLPASRSQF